MHKEESLWKLMWEAWLALIKLAIVVWGCVCMALGFLWFIDWRHGWEVLPRLGCG